ncbi:MAG: class I SAM-dependent methyltransferase [Candidatus Delongbacteria bacterium]
MGFNIGTDFDRAIQWDLRLERELPFLRAWLRSWNARHVTDLGCGTGRHCLALAQAGFELTGLDSNEEMLVAAGELLDGHPELAARCRFLAGDLRQPLGLPPQDAALCLGNSLCLLRDLDEVAQALSVIRDSLRPRGGLILHVLNYWKFRDPARAFFPLKTDEEDGQARRHFLKMIELHEHHALVHLIRIEQDPAGHWARQVRSDRLLRLDAPLLRKLLLGCGFRELQAYGSLQGETYQADSHDLVLCCRRS